MFDSSPVIQLAPRPEPLIVAVDGQAGAGKRVLAAGIAAALQLPHVSVGDYFRGIAWLAEKMRIPTDADSDLGELARQAPVVAIDGAVSISGRDISVDIRNDRFGLAASRVAASPSVRQAVRENLGRIGAESFIISGPSVSVDYFRDAAMRFFVSCRADIRAARSGAELGIEFQRRRDQYIFRDALELGPRWQDDLRSIQPVLVSTDEGVSAEKINLALNLILRHQFRQAAAAAEKKGGTCANFRG